MAVDVEAVVPTAEFEASSLARRLAVVAARRKRLVPGRGCYARGLGVSPCGDFQAAHGGFGEAAWGRT